MPDKMPLVMVYNGKIIGGALNFIGEDALYGRNWGADINIPNYILRRATITIELQFSMDCSVWKLGHKAFIKSNAGTYLSPPIQCIT